MTDEEFLKEQITKTLDEVFPLIKIQSFVEAHNQSFPDTDDISSALIFSYVISVLTLISSTMIMSAVEGASENKDQFFKAHSLLVTRYLNTFNKEIMRIYNETLKELPE